MRRKPVAGEAKAFEEALAAQPVAAAHYQHPQRVKSEQIIVAPTLVKKLPLPFRKIIGDLSDTERVLVGLDIVRR